MPHITHMHKSGNIYIVAGVQGTGMIENGW